MSLEKVTGLKVSPDGVLSWDLPADTSVRYRLFDSTGTSIMDNYKDTRRAWMNLKTQFSGRPGQHIMLIAYKKGNEVGPGTEMHFTSGENGISDIKIESGQESELKFEVPTQVEQPETMEEEPETISELPPVGATEKLEPSSGQPAGGSESTGEQELLPARENTAATDERFDLIETENRRNADALAEIRQRLDAMANNPSVSAEKLVKMEKDSEEIRTLIGQLTADVKTRVGQNDLDAFRKRVQQDIENRMQELGQALTQSLTEIEEGRRKRMTDDIGTAVSNAMAEHARTNHGSQPVQSRKKDMARVIGTIVVLVIFLLLLGLLWRNQHGLGVSLASLIHRLDGADGSMTSLTSDFNRLVRQNADNMAAKANQADLEALKKQLEENRKLQIEVQRLKQDNDTQSNMLHAATIPAVTKSGPAETGVADAEFHFKSKDGVEFSSRHAPIVGNNSGIVNFGGTVQVGSTNSPQPQVITVTNTIIREVPVMPAASAAPAAPVASAPVSAPMVPVQQGYVQGGAVILYDHVDPCFNYGQWYGGGYYQQPMVPRSFELRVKNR